MEEQDDQFSLLDSYTPQALIDRFNAMEDCTNALVELIKTTTHKNLSKMCHILEKTNSYSYDPIIELSQCQKRSLRYVTTHILMKLGKDILKNEGLETAMFIFDGVFAVRFRDVDPLIRGMVIQFLGDWILCNKELRNAATVKYLGWALNDKSDGVRRRTLRVFERITKTITEPSLYMPYKKRISEMATSDANGNVRKEAAELAIMLFSKMQVFGNDEVLAIASSDDRATKQKQLLLRQLCPDGIWDLDAIYSVYCKSNAAFFKNLVFDDSNSKEALIVNIMECITEDKCADENIYGFIDIIGSVDGGVSIRKALPLFELIKSNKRNVLKFIESLESTAGYYSYHEETERLLEKLYEYASEEPECHEALCKLLKKLEDDFKITVSETVRSLGQISIFPAIKYFDLSEFVSERSSTLEKCYSSLWMILNKNYLVLGLLEFHDYEHVPELLAFLVLFCEQAKKIDPKFTLNDSALGDRHLGGNGENKENRLQELSLASTVCPESHILSTLSADHLANNSSMKSTTQFCNGNNMGDAAQPINDNSSALKFLSSKLLHHLKGKIAFEGEKECIELHKLNEQGIFVEYSEKIFLHCSDGALRMIIKATRNHKALVVGYFAALAKEKRLGPYGKLIASIIPKTSTDRYVFNCIKGAMDRVDLYDTVFLYFVGLMTPDEAIVLECMAQKDKCKFKTFCTKKFRTKNIAENVTFI